jgi:hypothetical protein
MIGILQVKFTEITGISTWDNVRLDSESGTWTVSSIWEPKQRGGTEGGLSIELTKGRSIINATIMTDDGELTKYGRRLRKKI